MERKVNCNWSPEMDSFLKENCQKMPLKRLAHHLSKGPDCTRVRLYQLGLKKCTVKYWNNFEINYLKENFKTKGDTEIAYNLSQISLSGRRWTAGIIERKRSNLKLIRTEEEIKAIKKKNSLSVIKNQNYIRARMNARKTFGARRQKNLSTLIRLDQEIFACKNKLLEIIIYMIEYHKNSYPGRVKTLEIVKLENQAAFLQKQLEELNVARYKLPESIKMGNSINHLDKITHVIYLIMLKVCFTPLIDSNLKVNRQFANSINISF